MQIIDIIVELLETGRAIFGKNPMRVDASALGNDDEAIQKIIQLINQMVGFNRSEVILAYFEGKINQKNAILRLVIDEPREPLTDSLASILMKEEKQPRQAEVISISKRGRKDKYCERSCIEALRKAAESLGSRFSRMDYVKFTKTNDGLPSAATVVKHVGKNTSSWPMILTYAGLDRNAFKAAK